MIGIVAFLGTLPFSSSSPLSVKSRDVAECWGICRRFVAHRLRVLGELRADLWALCFRPFGSRDSVPQCCYPDFGGFLGRYVLGIRAEFWQYCESAHACTGLCGCGCFVRSRRPGCGNRGALFGLCRLGARAGALSAVGADRVGWKVPRPALTSRERRNGSVRRRTSICGFG